MNTNNFLKEINILFDNYGKKPTKDVLNAWYEILKDYDYRLLRKGIAKIMEQSKYMPTIKEILDAIKELPYEVFTEEEKIVQWKKEGLKVDHLEKDLT